jgi:hypothetical protein
MMPSLYRRANTTADVASSFMRTSKGISPAMGAARGYKAGVALGQGAEELQRRKDNDQFDRAAYWGKLERSAKVQERETAGGIAAIASGNSREAYKAVQDSKVHPLLDTVTYDELTGYAMQTEKGSALIKQGKADDLAKFEKEQKIEAARLAERAQTEVERNNRANNEKKAGGMTVYGPDGNPILTTGTAGENALSKDQAKKMDTKIYDAKESMARFQSIQSAYKPELLQLPARLSSRWTEFKDDLGSIGKAIGLDVSQEEKNLLVERSRLLRRTSSNLSLYIKDLSGAAVSVEEAERLQAALPNEDDSPIVFESKLQDAMDAVQSSLWRANYAKHKGLHPLASGYLLEDMDSIIQNEGQRLEIEIRKSAKDYSDEQVDEEVSRRMKTIFGMAE